MNFLSKPYNYFRQSSESVTKESSPSPEILERLLDRIIHGSLLEDRKNAIRQVQSILSQFSTNVGLKCIPVILKVLQDETKDLDMTRVSLEILVDFLTTERKVGSDESDKECVHLLVEDSNAIAALLNCLKESDFYVRFHSVQLLEALLTLSSSALQSAILAYPLGVSYLVDLLDERRESILNEALVLLCGLTRSNSDIQKIVAFENAFERILAIIERENGMEGGILVHDCLQLLYNLLKYNISNQNYFRETGCIPRLPLLLRVQDDLDFSQKEGSSWSEQKVTNFVLLLSIVGLLLSSTSPNTVINQNAMRQHGIVTAIISVSLSPGFPIIVRTISMKVLGDLIKGNTASQDVLGNSLTIGGRFSFENANAFPEPAIVQLIATIVAKNADFSLRGSATYLFQCFLFKNLTAQLTIATTLVCPPGLGSQLQKLDEPHSSGSLLFSALFEWRTARDDPYQSWFAAVLLCGVLRGNTRGKEVALGTVIEAQLDENSVLFLPAIAHDLIQTALDSADIRVQIGFYMLLSTWLHQHSPSVSSFLRNTTSVQFLIEHVIGSGGSDSIIQGLAAFALGICLQYCDDKDCGDFSRTSLESIVKNRIGLDQFLSRIFRLEASEFLNVSSAYLQPTSLDSNGWPMHYFDQGFADFFRQASAKIQSFLESPEPAGLEADSSSLFRPASPVQSSGMLPDDTKTIVASYKEQIKSQDAEIERYKETIDRLHDELDAFRSSQAPAQEYPVSDHSDASHLVEDFKSRIANLEEKLCERDTDALTLKAKLTSLSIEMNENVGKLQIENLERAQYLEHVLYENQSLSFALETEREQQKNLAELEYTISSQRETIERLYEQLESSRSDSIQPVSDEHVLETANLHRLLDEYRSDIANLEEKLCERDTDALALRAKLTSLSVEMNRNMEVLENENQERRMLIEKVQSENQKLMLELQHQKAANQIVVELEKEIVQYRQTIERQSVELDSLRSHTCPSHLLESHIDEKATLSRLLDDYKSRIANLEEKISEKDTDALTWKAKLTSLSIEMNSNVELLRKEILEKKALLLQAHQETKSLQAEIQSLRSELQHRSELEKDMIQFGERERVIKENVDRLTSEQENLFIFIATLEAKSKRSRQRLRNLGQTVSDDED